MRAKGGADKVEGESSKGSTDALSRFFSWPDHQPVPALVACAAVSLALGAGTFLIGKSTGPDLGQAEQQGRAAGTAKGSELGGARGYIAGFSKARQKAYRETYGRSYRRNYAKAYGEAGLDRPSLISIEVSR